MARLVGDPRPHQHSVAGQAGSTRAKKDSDGGFLHIPVGLSDSVRLVETAQDKERAYAIRHQVFVEEQGVPADRERDDYDNQDNPGLAWHWLAWKDGAAVATARLARPRLDLGKIGRVAVLSDFRRFGLGRQLMLAVHEWAEGQPIKQLLLDAQLNVVGFYEKLGYQVEGEIFEDCGIMHQRMVRWLA